MLYYLDNLIAFLSSDINFILYKNYFDFFYKTLDISNNEKKKRQSQIVLFLEIELDSLLMKARLPADNFNKAKL